MKKVLTRIKIFLKEALNLSSNFLVPFLSILALVLELTPVPYGWVKIVKAAEIWLFNFMGTMKDIEKEVEKITDKIE